MSYPIPPVVSERQIGPDHECEWCSGVMLRLANAPGSCPATLAEAQALHVAGTGSDTGGGNAYTLATGLTKRYKMASTVVAPPFPTLWAALGVGMAAAVAGNPANFPYGHYLRRFLPDYNGGHCVYAGRMDTSNYVWWIDPEGPDDGTYHGERVSSTELARFIGSWGGAHTVAAMKVVTDTRLLVCSTTLRSSPSIFAASVGTLPGGTVCKVVGTATNGYWTVNCGGPKTGKTWLHVTANGKNGYAPTGRFA